MIYKIFDDYDNDKVNEKRDCFANTECFINKTEYFYDLNDTYYDYDDDEYDK